MQDMKKKNTMMKMKRIMKMMMKIMKKMIMMTMMMEVISMMHCALVGLPTVFQSMMMTMKKMMIMKKTMMMTMTMMRMSYTEASVVKMMMESRREQRFLQGMKAKSHNHDLAGSVITCSYHHY